MHDNSINEIIPGVEMSKNVYLHLPHLHRFFILTRLVKNPCLWITNDHHCSEAMELLSKAIKSMIFLIKKTLCL